MITDHFDSYSPSPNRYDTMRYNRCGATGLMLPAISLGLWHNFGRDVPRDRAAALCRTAFDAGITHFDLANNYGPPFGAAEETFGHILRTDFRGHRNEIVVSTKAGYLMWPGPYGEYGSRKYMIASLDESLQRLGLDYVDIYYSHRWDPRTPLEETMGALADTVKQGKALYVGVSSYNAARTREAADILAKMGVPLTINQPSVSLLNRWSEDDGLTDTLEDLGVGSIAFSVLAQGLLSARYLDGMPDQGRMAKDRSLRKSWLNEANLTRIRGLNAIAQRRGQSLAQMAVSWVLHSGRLTSAIIGASRPEQIIDCIGALARLDFTDAELLEIDEFATDAGINMWSRSVERDGPDPHASPRWRDSAICKEGV